MYSDGSAINLRTHSFVCGCKSISSDGERANISLLSMSSTRGSNIHVVAQRLPCLAPSHRASLVSFGIEAVHRHRADVRILCCAEERGWSFPSSRFANLLADHLPPCLTVSVETRALQLCGTLVMCLYSPDNRNTRTTMSATSKASSHPSDVLSSTLPRAFHS